MPENDDVKQLVLEKIIDADTAADLCSRLKDSALLEHFPSNLALRTIDAMSESDKNALSRYNQFYLRNFGPIPAYEIIPKQYSSFITGAEAAFQDRLEAVKLDREAIKKVGKGSPAYDLFQAALQTDLGHVDLCSTLISRLLYSEGIEGRLDAGSNQLGALSDDQIRQIILQELFILENELEGLDALIKSSPDDLAFRVLQSIMINLNNQIANMNQFYMRIYGEIPPNTIPPMQFTNFIDGIRQGIVYEQSIMGISKKALQSLIKSNPSHALLMLNMLSGSAHVNQYNAILENLQKV